MPTSNLPVIFLAFANDNVGPGGHLKGITREKNEIERALKPGIGKLFELVVETGVSIQKIWEIFQDETRRGRIAIFHYGGHADSDHLLLESWTGENEMAYDAGLVDFLADQKSLRLVFLNGCWTSGLTEKLNALGIPAVIGTSAEIYDSWATELSADFYRALAQGLPLYRSWKDATNKWRAQNKGATRGINLYSQVENNWKLEFADGAEKIRSWNLPDAAGDPLFGLKLPKKYLAKLPEHPFKGLERYKEADAGIFFGRGKEIRALVQAIRGMHPVILFCGQSGVGKSSLLESGLLPRLTSEYRMVYMRRDPELGLLRSIEQKMQQELGMQARPSAQSEAEAKKQIIRSYSSKISALADNALGQDAKRTLNNLLHEFVRETKSLEATLLSSMPNNAEADEGTQKPMVLILDQVEEAFTNPLPTGSPKKELGKLCQAVKHALSDPETWDKKIVFSFRKEYLGEIENALNEHYVPFTKVFLEPLGRAGIVEAVNGITEGEFPSQKYQLGQEEGFAAFVASKLLDEGRVSGEHLGPIAPVLQLLLLKLWLKARQTGRLQLTKELYYQSGGREWLNEYFEKVVAEIRAKPEFTAAADSGMLHDICARFITMEGTAAQQSSSDLSKSFPESKKIIGGSLLKELVNWQILLSIRSPYRFYRLMHDSLAASIRRSWEHSNRPLQRLERVISNRLRNNELLALEETSFCEKWLDWYRPLNYAESRLIKESRKKHLKALALQYIRSGELKEAVSFVLDILEPRQDQIRVLRLELFRFKLRDLERQNLRGFLQEEKFGELNRKLEQELFELVNEIGQGTKEEVLASIKELNVAGYLSSRNIDAVLETLNSLVVLVGDEKLTNELSFIELEHKRLQKRIQNYFITPEENTNIKGLVMMELAMFCQHLGSKYNIDLFDRFPTPEKPHFPDPLPESKSLTSTQASSVSNYILDIIEEIRQGEIETPILRSIELFHALDEKDGLKVVENLLVSYADFTARKQWNALSIEKTSIIRNRLRDTLISSISFLQETPSTFKEPDPKPPWKHNLDELANMAKGINFLSRINDFSLFLKYGSIRFACEYFRIMYAWCLSENDKEAQDEVNGLMAILRNKWIRAYENGNLGPVRFPELSILIPGLIREIILTGSIDIIIPLFGHYALGMNSASMLTQVEKLEKEYDRFRSAKIRGTLTREEDMCWESRINGAILHLSDILQNEFDHWLDLVLPADQLSSTLKLVEQAQNLFGQRDYLTGLELLQLLPFSRSGDPKESFFQKMKVCLKANPPSPIEQDSVQKMFLHMANGLGKVVKQRVNKQNLRPSRQHAQKYFLNMEWNSLKNLLSVCNSGNNNLNDISLAFKKLDEAMFNNILNWNGEADSPLYEIMGEILELIDLVLPPKKNIVDHLPAPGTSKLPAPDFFPEFFYERLSEFFRSELDLENLIESYKKLENISLEGYRNIHMVFAKLMAAERNLYAGYITGEAMLQGSNQLKEDLFNLLREIVPLRQHHPNES